MTHEQAIRRLWRPGQDKPVSVHLLMVKAGEKDGIEQRIAKLCEQKRQMASGFIGNRQETDNIKGIDGGLTANMMGGILGINPL